MKMLKRTLLVLTTLTLVACSDEPKKYEFSNGIMGESVVGKTPQESVEALKDGKVPTKLDEEDELDANAKPTRTPTEGLSVTETKVIQTVDYFYQHLMNNEFSQVDVLVVPLKRNKNSYGEYYKKKLEDNGIILLDFTIDRITDKVDEETKETYYIIEVDVQQVVNSRVVTYRDSMTLTKEDKKWLIDSIETEVKTEPK